MLKTLLLGAFIAALAAQEAPKPQPPKREPLTDTEALVIRNLMLEYQLAVARVCSAHSIKLDACTVDAQTGTVSERLAAPARQAPVEKEKK